MSETAAHPLSYTAGFPSVGDPGSQASIPPALGTGTIGIPDSLVDVATCGPFEIRACSSRGMSHRYAGTPRQDAFALAADEDWVVVAVCDGVSSGKQSHVAADTAARSICKLALDALARDGVVDWLALSQRVSRRIIDEARYRRIADLGGLAEAVEVLRAVREQMSTTAVVACLSRHTHGDGVLSGELVVIAGDSGAFTISAGGVAPLIGGKDEEGSFTSGSVRPLPGHVAPKALRFTLKRGEAVLLVTDGIGDPLGAGDSALGRMIADAWAAPPPIGTFLDQVNFLMRSYDDDRTAVGLWWVHDAADRPAELPAESVALDERAVPAEEGDTAAEAPGEVQAEAQSDPPDVTHVVSETMTGSRTPIGDPADASVTSADASAGTTSPSGEDPADPSAVTVVISVAEVAVFDGSAEVAVDDTSADARPWWEPAPVIDQWVDPAKGSP